MIFVFSHRVRRPEITASRCWLSSETLNPSPPSPTLPLPLPPLNPGSDMDGWMDLMVVNKRGDVAIQPPLDCCIVIGVGWGERSRLAALASGLIYACRVGGGGGGGGGS